MVEFYPNPQAWHSYIFPLVKRRQQSELCQLQCPGSLWRAAELGLHPFLHRVPWEGRRRGPYPRGPVGTMQTPLKDEMENAKARKAYKGEHSTQQAASPGHAFPGQSGEWPSATALHTQARDRGTQHYKGKQTEIQQPLFYVPKVPPNSQASGRPWRQKSVTY